MAIASLPPEQKIAYPTHLDLPCSDDKPVDNDYHPLQSQLLRSCLAPYLEGLHPDGDYYVGTDTGIYWKTTNPPLNGCRAPDFFYVPDVPRLLDGAMRRSYVLWVETVAPLLVIEYLSGKGAEERDATPNKGKFWVYERAIRAPYYALWDPDLEKLEVFELNGRRYRPMATNENGRFLIEPMDLEFGTWEGSYFDHPGVWLRAWDPKGVMLPTAEEREVVAVERAKSAQKRATSERRAAEQEKQRADQEQQRADRAQQRADQEKQRAEQEKQRADKLAARLRELGVDPPQV